MRRSVRVVLAALGIAAAIYGAASLTGGWLGTPPWWQQTWVVERTWSAEGRIIDHFRVEGQELNPNREWDSGYVIAAGLGLAAFALWLGWLFPAPRPCVRPPRLVVPPAVK